MEKSFSFKKAPLKILRVLDAIKTGSYVVPTISKEAPQVEENPTTRDCFQPHSRVQGRGNPSQLLLKSLPQSSKRVENVKSLRVLQSPVSSPPSLPKGGGQ